MNRQIKGLQPLMLDDKVLVRWPFGRNMLCSCSCALNGAIISDGGCKELRLWIFLVTDLPVLLRNNETDMVANLRR